MRQALECCHRGWGVSVIIDVAGAGKINIDDLITHTVPLERINDAFDLMHRGESIRSVATF